MMIPLQDVFLLDGVEYDIISSESKVVFCAEAYGMIPEKIQSFFYEEYQCIFSVSEDDILILENLLIEEKNGYYPLINGVSAKKVEKKESYIYHKINLPFQYNGKILIGREMVPCSVPLPWSYKEVLELTFRDGKLKEVIDYSTDIHRIRIFMGIARTSNKRKRGMNLLDFQKNVEECLKKDGRAWWLEMERLR